MADHTHASQPDPGHRIGPIDGLVRLVPELRRRLESTDATHTESAALGLTADELQRSEIDLDARQIEALVALGILGRLVSGGDSRIVWIRGETESTARARLTALATVAEALRAAMASVRALAHEIETIDGLVEPAVDARQVEALIALGVLGRIISGGSASLVWIGRRAPVHPGPVLVGSTEGDVDAGAAGTAGAAVAEAAGAAVAAVAEAAGAAAAKTEEFELDVAADYEHERLLMYRVMIAFEAVGAIVLVREIVLRVT
jgi:hypothetical protein